MPLPFPHRYEMALTSHDGGARLSSTGRPDITGGAPPEFDGRAEWWSPEHLLLSSVALCLMTTAQALAARARVPIGSYESRAHAVLDKTSAGLVFTEIAVRAEVAVAEEHRERMRALMESASKHCIVSNALSVPVTVDAQVTAFGGQPPAAARG
jgi:organic hydroperoxide reductase OsmC/OhrA